MLSNGFLLADQAIQYLQEIYLVVVPKTYRVEFRNASEIYISFGESIYHVRKDSCSGVLTTCYDVFSNGTCFKGSIFKACIVFSCVG